MKQHVFVFPSQYAALVYAILTGTGLLLSLFVGLHMHPKQLLATHCETAEYWPSISTTTGDFQPERQIWRSAFVLCAPFRLGATISLFFVFWVHGSGGAMELRNAFQSLRGLFSSSACLSLLLFFFDILRLLGALGWTMISSAEELGHHNVAFGTYILMGSILQGILVVLSRRNAYNMNVYVSVADSRASFRLKKICLVGQLTTAVSLVLFYIRHNVTCAPGSFSLSTMCEWCFAGFNIIFDGSGWYELKKDAWYFGGPKPKSQLSQNQPEQQEEMQRQKQESEMLKFGRNSDVSSHTDSGYNCNESTSVVNIHDVVLTKNIDDDKKILPKEVIVHVMTFCCAPANFTMWLVDIYWSYLLWESIVHLVQHMYFMPLVAMSISWELLSVVAFGSPMLMRFASFRRWAMGPAPFADTLLKPPLPPSKSHRRAPMYVFFYLMFVVSHLHIHVRRSERVKLLWVAGGSFFLSLATFCHSIYPSTAAPAESPIDESSDESCRLIYSLPIGLIITMLVRVLFISLDPVFADPFYGGLFGIVLGIACTTVVYRQAMFREGVQSEGHNSSRNDQHESNASRNSNDDYDDEKGNTGTDSRHVHFSREYRYVNEIVTLAHKCSIPSPFLSGLLFGLLSSVSLTFFICANYIPRLLAIDPYPASLFVILFFIFGLYCSQDVLQLGQKSKNGVAPRSIIPIIFGASWFRFGIVLFGGTLTMLLGTRQTNRSFELPHPNYPTRMESLRENVDIKWWDAEEEFAGNKYIAFLGGLLMTFCIGALFPVIMELTLVHKRIRNLESSSAASSERLLNNAKVHIRGDSLSTSFEFSWFATVLGLCMINAFCISYPFVPMGWIFREKTALMHFSTVAGLFFLAWFLVSRVTKNVHTHAENPTFSRSHRSIPIPVTLFIVFIFLTALIGRTCLEPPDRSIESGKDAARRYTHEVLELHEVLKKLKTESNKARDPLIKPFEREYITATYNDILKQLENEFKERNEEKNINDPSETYRRLLENQTDLITKYGVDFPHLTQEQKDEVWDAAKGMTFFSGMIWTVHFALDNGNTDSLSRMAKLAEATGAGVVGILESDAMHLTNGNRDIAEYLSYYLGYRYTDYGPTALDNTYGCAMISKYPILRVRRYIIPSPLGELSCIIHAHLDVYGIVVNTYVGHFGNTEHWADGLLQSQFLSRLAQRNPGPSLYLGYVVSYPGNPERYMRYAAPNTSGLFRDTALEMYREHPWKRMHERGGYDESGPEPTSAPLENVDFDVEWKLSRVRQLETGMQPDPSFRRTPTGKPPRYFRFEDTGRITTAHPRFEFIDRYCQYTLYKTGATKDEPPLQSTTLQPMEMYLYDWWREVDGEVSELSDTEIQVVQLGFKART